MQVGICLSFRSQKDSLLDIKIGGQMECDMCIIWVIQHRTNVPSHPVYLPASTCSVGSPASFMVDKMISQYSAKRYMTGLKLGMYYANWYPKYVPKGTYIGLSYMENYDQALPVMLEFGITELLS